MKIGIVTFFKVPNYGAMLQAYALWQYLADRGHEVRFLDHDFCRQYPCKLWKCFISRNLKGVRNKLGGIVLYRITDFAAAYPLGVVADDYDAIIVGSDQMWNPKWCSNPKWIELLFLGFAKRGTKRLSYAASFGTDNWSADGMAKRTGELLKEFAAISVREESGIKVVEGLSGRSDAKCLLDPTLLHDGDFYRKIAEPVQDKPPYIFNYMLGWSGGIEEKNALEIVRSHVCDKVLNDKTAVKGAMGVLCKIFGVNGEVPVTEWLGCIASSQFVVTNSFHGTVFSILFHRPFISLKIKGEMSGMNERAATLMKIVGLEDRFLFADDVEGINKSLKTDIDWMSVEKRLSERRKDTDLFFRGVGI